MQQHNYQVETDRYAKCIQVSKRVRWDIDDDVIRGREFDFSQKFHPAGISKLDQLDFLNDDEKRLLRRFCKISQQRASVNSSMKHWRRLCDTCSSGTTEAVKSIKRET